MKEIYIDFLNRTVRGSITATEADNTNEEIRLICLEGTKRKDLTNKTLRLTMKKVTNDLKPAKGQFINIPVVNQTQGLAKIIIDKTFTKSKGDYELQLTILNSAGFVENSVLFNARIARNLAEEVAEGLTGSSEFIDLTETLEKAKDIVANEEERKRNEVARIQSEATREVFFDEQVIPAIEKVDSFAEQVGENTKGIERAFEVINEGSFLPFEGREVTIEHSKEGYTKDMQIKGVTLQNLMSIDEWSNGTRTGNSFRKSYLVKANATYTVCAPKYDNSFPNFQLGVFNHNASAAIVSYSHKNKITFKIPNDYPSGEIRVYYQTKDGTGLPQLPQQLKEVILLEGDWTSKEIPNFFEGIKSSGEEGKIDYFSYSNLIDFNETFFPAENQLKDSDFYNCYIPKGHTFSFAPYSNGEISKVTTQEIMLFDKDKRQIDTWACIGTLRYITTTYNVDIHYAKVRFYATNISTTPIDGYKVILGKSENTKLTEYGLDKKDFRLPYEFGHKSIGNTKDIIEIRQDGIYAIQKIERKILTSEEAWNLEEVPELDTVVFWLRDLEGSVYGLQEELNILSDFTITRDVYGVNRNEEGIRLGRSKSGVYIRVKRSRLPVISVMAWKQYLQQIGGILIYFKKDNPKNYRIENVTSLNLKTSKGTTYVAQRDLIKANVNFKAPVDVPKTISALRAKNTILLSKNEELQAKNEELEDINRKQTIKIIELDDTTNFLIEDALSRKLNE